MKSFLERSAPSRVPTGLAPRAAKTGRISAVRLLSTDHVVQSLLDGGQTAVPAIAHGYGDIVEIARAGSSSAQAGGRGRTAAAPAARSVQLLSSDVESEAAAHAPANRAAAPGKPGNSCPACAPPHAGACPRCDAEGRAQIFPPSGDGEVEPHYPIVEQRGKLEKAMGREFHEVPPAAAPAGGPAATPVLKQGDSLTPEKRVELARKQAAGVVTEAFGAPFVQAKLAIGSVDDPLEREADAVADRVLDARRAAPVPAPSAAYPGTAQTACDAWAREGEQCTPYVQRRAVEGPGIARALEADDVRSATAGGRPLTAEERSFFEPRFGFDFSKVRIHSDDRAAVAARAIDALAFTRGSDIVLCEPIAQRTSPEGARLLAHELAHVVQQGAAAPLGTGAPHGVAGATPSAGAATGVLQRAPATPSKTFGDAQTTAPFARTSPGRELRDTVAARRKIFDRAAAIQGWIARIPLDRSNPLVSPALIPMRRFELAELAAAAPKLKITTDLELLREALRLLAEYGVVASPSGNVYTAPHHPESGRLRTERFDAAHEEIRALEKRYDAWVTVSDPSNPVVETRPLDLKVAHPNVARAIANADSAGTELERCRDTGKPCDAEAARLAAAEKKLRAEEATRIFAKPVADFLEALAGDLAGSMDVRAATRYDHNWGEFSADVVFPGVKRYKKTLPGPSALVDWGSLCIPGKALAFSTTGMSTPAASWTGDFWDVEAMKTFFDAVNARAERGVGGYGKFAWSAVYNDCDVVSYINKQYGAGRCFTVLNHGPDPDFRLHVHLDLRPAVLPAGMVVGVKKGS